MNLPLCLDMIQARKLSKVQQHERTAAIQRCKLQRFTCWSGAVLMRIFESNPNVSDRRASASASLDITHSWRHRSIIASKDINCSQGISHTVPCYERIQSIHHCGYTNPSIRVCSTLTPTFPKSSVSAAVQVVLNPKKMSKRENFRV